MQISIVALAIVAVVLGGTAHAAERPNILWITFEDCSPILGCYGERLARTPTLDRLAADGIRYTRTFSPSGVCAPSRAAIITGCYPTAIGAMHMRTGQRSLSRDKDVDPASLPPAYEAVPPPDVHCFPELLRAAGYYCTNRSKRDYQFVEPATVWDACSRKAHPKHRAPGQPYFAVFNFAITHESRLFQRTQPAEIDRSAVSVPPYLPDTPTVREVLARQLDNLAALDRRIARLLAELEKGGLLEDTIVFLFADHGSGIARGKRWILDSGTRVPLIVRFPDQRRAGSVDDRLVSFVDLGPTVLRLCGVEIPAAMHGRPFLGGDEATPREFVFMARDRTDWNEERIRSVRGKRFRYVWNGRPELPSHPHVTYHARVPMVAEIEALAKAGALGPDQWQLWRSTKPPEELYDLAADPHEIRNLIGDPAQADTLSRLRGALRDWTTRHGDHGLRPEWEYFRAIWPGGTQPVTASPQITRHEDTLTLACATAGASLGWRVVGETTWRVYTGPVAISDETKIDVMAHRIGYRPSK